MARLLVRCQRPPPALHRHAPAGGDAARLRQALEHHPRRRGGAVPAPVFPRPGAAPGPPSGGAHLLPRHPQGARPDRLGPSAAGRPAPASDPRGRHHPVLNLRTPVIIPLPRPYK